MLSMTDACCVPTLWHPPVEFGKYKETRHAFKMPFYEPVGACSHSADTALQFIKDMAWALRYMHLRGYVYGDMKPPNTFRNTRGTGFLLADFTLTSTLLMCQDPLCTHWYRSPELFVGVTPDPRPSDVWALGVSALEMLTGNYPAWGGRDDKSTHARLQNMLPVMEPHVASEIDAAHACALFPQTPEYVRSLAVLRTLLPLMLARDPAQRPTAAEVYRHAASALL